MAAQFTWRAQCDWVNGTHSRAQVQKFNGLGEEQQHRRMFDFDVDHPEIFAAEDNGVTPVEYILVGLAWLSDCRHRIGRTEPRHSTA